VRAVAETSLAEIIKEIDLVQAKLLTQLAKISENHEVQTLGDIAPK